MTATPTGGVDVHRRQQADRELRQLAGGVVRDALGEDVAVRRHVQHVRREGRHLGRRRAGGPADQRVEVGAPGGGEDPLAQRGAGDSGRRRRGSRRRAPRGRWRSRCLRLPSASRSRRSGAAGRRGPGPPPRFPCPRSPRCPVPRRTPPPARSRCRSTPPPSWRDSRCGAPSAAPRARARGRPRRRRHEHVPAQAAGGGQRLPHHVGDDRGRGERPAGAHRARRRLRPAPRIRLAVGSRRRRSWSRRRRRRSECASPFAHP